MFVKVQDLTSLIDTNINYLKEAKENKTKFDKVVYNKYVDDMIKKINLQFGKLQKISTNTKVINKYTALIKDILEGI